MQQNRFASRRDCPQSLLGWWWLAFVRSTAAVPDRSDRIHRGPARKGGPRSHPLGRALAHALPDRGLPFSPPR